MAAAVAALARGAAALARLTGFITQRHRLAFR